MQRTFLGKSHFRAPLPSGLDVYGQRLCHALRPPRHVCHTTRDLHALYGTLVQLLQRAGQLVLYWRVLPGACPPIHARHATCMRSTEPSIIAPHSMFPKILRTRLHPAEYSPRQQMLWGKMIDQLHAKKEVSKRAGGIPMPPNKPPGMPPMPACISGIPPRPPPPATAQCYLMDLPLQVPHLAKACLVISVQSAILRYRPTHWARCIRAPVYASEDCPHLPCLQRSC